MLPQRRSGRCREWIKIKNRAHPANERAMLIALSKRTGSRPNSARSEFFFARDYRGTGE
jgi:hypothetical protein